MVQPVFTSERSTSELWYMVLMSLRRRTAERASLRTDMYLNPANKTDLICIQRSGDPSMPHFGEFSAACGL